MDLRLAPTALGCWGAALVTLYLGWRGGLTLICLACAAAAVTAHQRPGLRWVGVAAANLAEVIAKGEERERYEAELRDRISAGATTFELGALEERARRVGIL